MSKHVGNVIDPFQMIHQYGADPVRFYMMTNSEPWDNLKFDKDGVDEVRRKFLAHSITHIASLHYTQTLITLSQKPMNNGFQTLRHQR